MRFSMETKETRLTSNRRGENLKFFFRECGRLSRLLLFRWRNKTAFFLHYRMERPAFRKLVSFCPDHEAFLAKGSERQEAGAR